MVKSENFKSEKTIPEIFASNTNQSETSLDLKIFRNKYKLLTDSPIETPPCSPRNEFNTEDDMNKPQLRNEYLLYLTFYIIHFKKKLLKRILNIRVFYK